uniref:twin-arginine translocation signal domain-containing protein n=1 Tax=uncultured Sunxiuqinia sp. TaxID=1573825 RepID=UPI0030DB9984
MNQKLNRRNFLGKAALGAAAVTIIPRHVMGGNGYVAANDRINLGYIGTGKQGRILLNYFTQNCKDAVPVAACEVYQAKLGLFMQQAKKADPNGSIQTYEFYRELLA